MGSTVVVSNDLSTEERWPRWAPRVLDEFGVRSMMGIHLFAEEETLGALNLYSTKSHAFVDDTAVSDAEALAAHVAVALLAAQEVQHLITAITSRTIIGQAEGILMERFGLTGDRAFEVLQRVSSHTNTKLNQVAAELVATRLLPKS